MYIHNDTRSYDYVMMNGLFIYAASAQRVINLVFIRWFYGVWWGTRVDPENIFKNSYK